MSQNKQDKKTEGISTYNTFKVFESIYQEEDSKEDYWEIKAPARKRGAGTGVKFLVFVFVLAVVGLGVYPILSYSLKTPYPLVVISEDNLAPMVGKNDLVLVRGIIDKREIELDDLIVYADTLENNSNLLVQKVVDINKEEGIVMVRGVSVDSLGSAVEMNQVLGKVVGEERPFRVPFMGQLIGYLAGK
jgi:hypothetical protein